MKLEGIKNYLNRLYELVVLLQATTSSFLLVRADDDLVKALSLLSFAVVVKSLIHNYLLNKNR